MAEGKVDDARFAEMDREAKRLAAESVHFAEESPEPPLEDLHKYTFVEGSNQ
jgi:TPP-dependent pyruvate/acetoin dehydrogenase alpha subunit